MKELARLGEYLYPYEVERHEQRYLITDAAATLIQTPADAEELADVSFYQARMNWALYPYRAAILRIGQNTWKDTEFEYNYAEASRNYIALGGYHFYDGRVSPRDQADMIVAAMKDKVFQMELWVDWERSYSGNWEGIENVVWLMQLVENAGVKCKAVGIYTGYYYFTDHTHPITNASQFTYLMQRPLWLAWYASPSVVMIPAPWKDYTLWQWGTPVIKAGQPTAEIDMNKSRYGYDEFTIRYLNKTESITMNIVGTVNATAGLRVRQGPGTTYAIIGTLAYNAEVKGILYNGWIQIDYNGQIGYVMAQYVTYTQAPTTTLPEIHITSLGNDYYAPFDFTVKPK